MSLCMSVSGICAQFHHWLNLQIEKGQPHPLVCAVAPGSQACWSELQQLGRKGPALERVEVVTAPPKFP